jgi:PAS domain S-box-containing protein
VRDQDGTPTGYVVLVSAAEARDRSRAQAQAAEQAAVWQTALDALPGRAAVLDGSGAVVAVSRSWQQFSKREGGGGGVTVGASYLAACAASRDPAATQAAGLLKEMLAGTRDRFELEYAHPTAAQRRWFKLRGTRLHGAGAARVVVVHDEVSASHRLEEHAATQAALLRQVDAAIIVTDLECRVQSWSSGAEKLYGYSAREAVGQLVAELLDPGGDVLDRCALLRDRFFDSRSTARRKDGSLVSVHVYHELICDDEGAPQAIVGVSSEAVQTKQLAHETELEELVQVAQIRAALQEERFVLHAQPIVDARTGSVTQWELLLRMQPAAGGEALVPPAVFLPAAEKHGLIGDIDRWVVDRAAEFAAEGHAVQVNLSGPSVSDPTLAAHIEAALAHAGADPRALIFEITETTIVTDELAARTFVERMHALGCRIALDDFGTGYGTFTYLKHLPIDYLKVDIEFVRDLGQNPASRKVVEAIVSLAASFGLSTIGEGIEHEETLSLLRELGVEYAQGFYLGRPAPAPARLAPR